MPCSPSLIIPFADFSVAGPVEGAGRPAIRALARPRALHAERLGLSPLPLGADAHELLVDAERGILLRLESRIDGAPLSVAEILEVAFDEDPPAFEVFAPTLAPEGTELHVFYQPASARGVGASVHLAYAHHAHSLSIAESLVADGDYGDTGWEEREHAGRRYLTRDVHGQQHLLVDLGGRASS